jgi:septal ring factor EnvC (AmiA/AmiB activator)
MSQELVSLEKINALDLFSDDKEKSKSILSKIKEEISRFSADAETKEGREEIRSFARKIASFKIEIDSIGKSLTEDIKKKCKLVDASRKEVWDELERLQRYIRDPLTAFEAKENERIDKFKQTSEMLRNVLIVQIIGSEHLASMKVAIESIECGESWLEFRENIAELKNNALIYINTKIVEFERIEKERAELEVLRKEKEERDLKEAQEKQRKEIEERAKIEAELKVAKDIENARLQKELAERKQKELEERIERERTNAELREKAALEKAEKEKLTAIEEEKKRQELEAKKIADEEARRNADIEHKRIINTAALKLFIENDISEEIAKKVLTLIISGKINNVKIIY